MAEYRYALEFYRQDGTTVGRAPAVPDLEPLREAAWFEALRAGRIDTDADAGGLPVSPVWNKRVGAPYLQGLRVGAAAPDEESVSGVTAASGDAISSEAPSRDEASPSNGAAPIFGEYGLAVFTEAAQLAMDALVEQEVLAKGDTAYYLVAAYPVDADADAPLEAPADPAAAEPGANPEPRPGPETEPSPTPKPRLKFTTRTTTPPLPLRKTSLDGLRPRMRAVGPHAEPDMPALIPADIHAEVAELSRNAEGNETGGVLIGHVHRDPRTDELFVEVTAQIPALHTEAESSRLTFTPQTWTAVRAALELRNRGELMLGWWHSHPVREWCKDCPEETRENCALSCDYFSAQDRALHRAVFPRAYSLALVVNDVAGPEPTFSLFGWKDGRIDTRGYHRLEPEPTAGDPAELTASTTLTTSTSGGDHVQ